MWVFDALNLHEVDGECVMGEQQCADRPLVDVPN
jgi:hypothetical protein